jgi:hypothetical protein
MAMARVCWTGVSDGTTMSWRAMSFHSITGSLPCARAGAALLHKLIAAATTARRIRGRVVTLVRTGLDMSTS